jgi:dTDP-4-dehydrorhamnose 3,5-epimerase
MHYQLPPAGEAKLLRCTSGALCDVIIDLRPESSTYLQHVSVELSARNLRWLYVPQWFAHGFQTLEDETEVFYQISEFYAPAQATGLRFDDPALKITWPLTVSVISEKDLAWPLLGSHTAQPLPKL